jgi:hypothetical protein
VEARPADRLRRLFRQDAYGPAFLQVPYGVRGNYFVAARRRRPAVRVGLDPDLATGAETPMFFTPLG